MSSPPPRDVRATASIGTCPACGGDVFAGDRFCGSCGAAVPQGAETELLADLEQVTLGEYEIRGVLGRGGMGLVYLAHDLSLNRKVAIKVLPPSMLQGEASVERFRREARIAASLRHRHITSVFGLKETTKLVFFLMEYVEGRTLDAILHDAKRLEIDTAEAVIHDAAGALSYAHRREVVHRDLKPANIIVDAEGMAMITDFGVAKLSTSQGLTTAGATVGSPKYMSPEQWSGKATGLSDQYALGCVAYELLAGRAPFEGDTIEELMKQHLFDPPRPVSELRPECPPALAQGVMRMLQKDPGERWPSLEAATASMGVRAVAADDPVRQNLAQLAKRGHDVRALPKTPKSPIPVSKITRRQAPGSTASTRARRLIPWALAAVVVIGVALYYLLPRPPESGGRAADSIATLEIAGAPPTLGQGERVALTAHAKTATGATLAQAGVTWSSSDSSIAAVAEDGTVRAVGLGTATLTARSGGKSASVTLAIQPAASITLEVTPRAATLTPGGAVRLTAVAKDARGTLLTGRHVAWSSSDPSVVTVAPNGVATGVGAGTAIVTATSEGRSTTVAITVGSPARAAVASLDVSPARLRLPVRGTSGLQATARDARGKPVTGRRVAWVSSNPAVATVTPTGVVAGVAPGLAMITAASDGITSTPAEVTVVAAGPGPAAILQVMVAPVWAYASIDGLPRGERTRLVDTLPSGVRHRLHFERAGFETIDTTVTLQPGETRLVRILMTPKN